MTRSFNQIAVHGDELAWIEYFMLARALLPATGQRGGKSHAKRVEQHVKTRCRRWLEGDRAALWADAVKLCSRGQKRGRPEPSDEVPDSLVHEHVAAGQLSKAAAALISDPPVEVTEDVIKEMRDKHPGARRAEEQQQGDLRPVDPAGAVQVGIDDVLKAIRSFPKGSAPGTNGLRPQHLIDAMCHGTRHELLRQITNVVNKLLQGQVPNDIKPWLCGARLAALPKPQGDLRPVACGDTLRRITGKAAFAEAGDEIRALLEPLQMGVGTPCGAEAMIHTTRQWLGRNSSNPDKVLLLLDLANAFNTVDRWAVRKAFRRFVPRLAPWVDACYGAPSVVLLGDTELSSEQGVQQGDPGGPAAFALGIHECLRATLETVQSELPGEIDWAAFYLDDGAIAGTARAVRRFLTLIQGALGEIGLKVNLDKCEVIPAAGASSSARREQFPDVVFHEEGNFKLLGASFGNYQFHKALLDKRVVKAVKVLKGATRLESAQDSLAIVRQCAGFCKLVYSLRVTPPDVLLDSARAFEEALRHSIETVVGDVLPDRSWELAGLRVKDGGLGVRHPTKHAHPAYIASFQDSSELAKSIDASFDPMDMLGHSGISSAIDTLNTIIPPTEAISIGDPPRRQKQLSALVDFAVRKKLLVDNSVDPYFCAHVALLSAEGAGAWLTALPEEEQRSWQGDAELFRIALKRRCRVAVQEGDAPCPRCGGIMDCFGDHALVCPCSGDRTVRHNALRDLTFTEAASARCSPEREKGGLLPGRPVGDGALSSDPGSQEDRRRRPADVYLPRGVGGPRRQPAALDWAVTSGLRSDRIQHVAQGSADVLAEYADYKRTYKDTQTKCQEQGIEFVPLVIEAHGGGWGAQLRQAVGFLAIQQKAAGEWCREGAPVRIAQRISTSLQRENARAVLRRLSATGQLAEGEVADLEPSFTGLQ